MNIDVTFLKEEQIWGDAQGNGQLQVMRGFGTPTGLSDLARVLGSLMGIGRTSDQRTGHVWSASSFGYGYVRTVHEDGGRYSFEPYERAAAGARPALPSSETSKIQPSEARLTRKIGDIQVVEYAEYPQKIASDDVTGALNAMTRDNRDQLEEMRTGRKYTFDGRPLDAFNDPFAAREYNEYEYNRKRYIRVEAQPYYGNFVLPNSRRPERGEPCWIEVQPIEWLADPSGVWVARQALFSGVQFDRNQNYYGDFAETDMKKYLDNYFSKEMLAARDVSIPDEWRRWNDSTVLKIARTIYNERTFDAMPILADALEDAGCTSAGILEHLRQNGPRTRADWVLKAILGPERDILERDVARQGTGDRMR